LLILPSYLIKNPALLTSFQYDLKTIQKWLSLTLYWATLYIIWS